MDICLCEGADIDDEVKDALEKGFNRLRYCMDPPPLKRHLPKRLLNLLQYRTTPLGATLLDVVRVGLLHFDAEIGAYAPDQYAYDTYQVLFDRLLEERHGFLASQVHPKSNWGDWDHIANLDPEGRYIISTRVRCARNLDGFRFTPTMSPVDFETVESVIIQMLELLPWDYSGEYIPMQSMADLTIQELIDKHLFFLQGNAHERAGNISRFWPMGRGVFFNKDYSFGVWVNEKDHLRAIAIEPGGNLREAYKRIAVVMPVLDKRLPPATHPRLGYLTVCPGNVGSALRVSVLIRMPNVPWDQIVKVAKVYRLEVDEIEKQVFCISNKRSLGYSEYAVAMQFTHGTREMIKLQRNHESKGTVITDSDDSLEEEKKTNGAVKELMVKNMVNALGLGTLAEQMKLGPAGPKCATDEKGHCPCDPNRPVQKVTSPRSIHGAMLAEIEFRRCRKLSISKMDLPEYKSPCEGMTQHVVIKSPATENSTCPTRRQGSPRTSVSGKISPVRSTKSSVKEISPKQSRRGSGASSPLRGSESVPTSLEEEMLHSAGVGSLGNLTSSHRSTEVASSGVVTQRSEKSFRSASPTKSMTSYTSHETSWEGEETPAAPIIHKCTAKPPRRISVSSKNIRGNLVKVPAIRSTRATARNEKKTMADYTAAKKKDERERERDKKTKKNWKQMLWV